MRNILDFSVLSNVLFIYAQVNLLYHQTVACATSVKKWCTSVKNGVPHSGVPLYPTLNLSSSQAAAYSLVQRAEAAFSW